ncbi:MAG: MFS transporter [Roseibacillus sp.]|nr:MFS transporter [Roseibacillus sp.]
MEPDILVGTWNLKHTSAWHPASPALWAAMRGGQRPIFYGYAIVAAAFVLTLASGPGQSFAFSVFQPEILKDTGLSATSFSLIYALGSGFSAFLIFILGRCLDRFGARASLVVIAILLFVASLGMALATGFLSLLLALALLRAIGQGCLPTTASVLTSQWFVTRRGFALSLGTMGVVTANAILPPIAHHLIGSIGWRATYLWIGGVLSIAILLLTWLVIRNRPEDLGLHPDGAAEALPELNEESAPRDRSKFGVWKTGRFWALVLPLCVPPFVATAAMFHQVSLFEAQGLSARDSAYAFSYLALAAACSTLTAGWLLDKIGVRNTTILMLLFLVGAAALLAAMNSPALALLYSLCLGSSLGLWAVTNSITWPHYYGRDGLGAVQGSATTILLIASAIAPLPIAYLHAAFHSHRAGIGVLLAVAVLAAGITAPRRRKKPA